MCVGGIEGETGGRVQAVCWGGTKGEAGGGGG